MPKFIMTVFTGEKEIPILGLCTGVKVDLSEYECRRIYPQDWLVLTALISPKAFDVDITYFLEKGYEIRLYRKNSS